MDTNRPSKELIAKWAPVLRRIITASQDGSNPLAGFRIAAEYAMQDEDFLRWWREQVNHIPEPTKHRAISFLKRLAARGPDWNFEKEFRRSFD